MSRTKYYWGLVECDSVSTASWLYEQMDGLEADGSSARKIKNEAACHFLPPSLPQIGAGRGKMAKFVSKVTRLARL